MDYNTELKRYFEAAWNDYARTHKGADKQRWFNDNAANLKKYFDGLFAQKQAQQQAQQQQAKPQYDINQLTYMATASGNYQNPAAAAQQYAQTGKWPAADKSAAPAQAPAAPAQAPAQPSQNAQQQPTAADLMAINQAIQNIMASEKVDRATAEKIFARQIPRPSDNTYMPEPGTGVPLIPGKPGLDWETLAEQARANKAQEDLARQRIELEQGMAIGKVGGTNTLESIKYANDILANPRNAALAEQVRKGFALGDLPGQTVASYLTRSVEGTPAMPQSPQVPGAAGGDVLKFGELEKQQNGSQDPMAAFGGAGLVQAFQKSGLKLDDFLRRLQFAQRLSADLKKAYTTKRSTGRDVGVRGDLSWIEQIFGIKPEGKSEFSALLEPLATSARNSLMGTTPEQMSQRGYYAAPDEYTLQQTVASLANRYRPWENPETEALWSGMGEFTQGLAGGGSTVIGGQPHWIVDNSGKPVAALTEDGKPEQVKGKNNGVEVVPLDPQRKAAYEARKRSVPGMIQGGIGTSFKGRRTAPSRRPGASIGNASRTQSGTRASLPGDVRANTRPGVTDARANNGTTNNGRVAANPNLRDRDAKTLLPAAQNVQDRIRARGPVPVTVQPRPPAMGFPAMGFANTGLYRMQPTIMRPIGQQPPAGSILQAPGTITAPRNPMNIQGIGDLNGDGVINSGDQLLMAIRKRALLQTPVLGTSPLQTRDQGSVVTAAATGSPLIPLSDPNARFIASGGSRVLGNNIRAPRFGFAATAPTDIAGRNVISGVKNLPGVYVRAPWKFNPRTFRTMTDADRQLLESYVSGTGQDPASFWNQAGFAEPRTATTGRSFY